MIDKLQFDTVISADFLDIEDGGQAIIATLHPEKESDAGCGPFVRLQSWCECGDRSHFRTYGKEAKLAYIKSAPHHLQLEVGTRLRVTIERLP